MTQQLRKVLQPSLQYYNRIIIENIYISIVADLDIGRVEEGDLDISWANRYTSVNILLYNESEHVVVLTLLLANVNPNVKHSADMIGWF